MGFTDFPTDFLFSKVERAASRFAACAAFCSRGFSCRVTGWDNAGHDARTCRMILVRTCKMPLGLGTPLQLRDRCSAHRRSSTSCATTASAEGTVNRGRAARRGGRWNSCCSCDAQQRLQQRVGTAHGGWSDEDEVKKVSQITAHPVHQLQSEYSPPEPGPEARRLLRRNVNGRQVLC